MSWADNSIIIWRNLPICNPKLDFHSINVHIKFGENPLRFTQVIVLKQNIVILQADNSVKNWQNLPISNPKPDLYNINCITKLLLKLLSANKIKDMLRADNSVKNWQNLPISNHKQVLHSIIAHTKFDVNPLICTGYHLKMKI